MDMRNNFDKDRVPLYRHRIFMLYPILIIHNPDAVLREISLPLVTFRRSRRRGDMSGGVYSFSKTSTPTVDACASLCAAEHNRCAVFTYNKKTSDCKLMYPFSVTTWQRDFLYDPFVELYYRV